MILDNPDIDTNNDNQVITMGCRLNGYESDVIKNNLIAEGISDVIVINSCSVTAEAVRQTRQTIRKLSKTNPDKKIIVTGCAAQTEPETFAKMPEVFKILGNHEKLLTNSFSNLLSIDNTEKIAVNDIMSVKETAGHMISGLGDKARSYLQIQNGCDHRCTFCIIPFGRGNSRSVPAGVVIDNIKKLVDNGVKEVILTGVDLTSWGHDLPTQPTLGKIVEKILNLVPDLPRLRLSSVDSIEIDETLFDIMIHDKRFMPHLHLSLQSGDNMILKRMKRRHTREHAVEFCHKLKQNRPEFVFGADIIAAFPTETDDMFANSVQLITDIGIIYGHIFPYSPRIGTPAARMPQIAKDVIKRRAAILRQTSEQLCTDYYQSLIGKVIRCVAEADGYLRSETFVRLWSDTPTEHGTLYNVRATHLSNKGLIAEIVA
jgi:threonylcarbamoyladenosine tRNA methylthiotransferase MtaB